MKENYVILMDNPCSEDWEKMTPSEKGRFCGKCQTEVVDFTKMHRDQVVDYLLNKTNQDTCGRYKNHQLGNQKSRFQNCLIKMQQKVYSQNRFKLPRFVLLMSLGLILTITGCGSKNPISGEITISSPKSIDYTYGGKMRTQPKIIDLPVEKIEKTEKRKGLPFYNFKKK